jgi:metallo-beta-lactamase family protein
MIKISFEGAARDVTGSRHLLQINDRRILMDCGLYQGRRKDTYERNWNFPFDPGAVDAVLLSHAHIDHIGNIPNLVKKGFKGDIHCTMATADLVNVMLMDAAHIQESDAEFVTKLHLKRGQEPVKPLYTRADIPPVLQLLVSHGYNRPFIPVEGVKVVFREAGHILGSAISILALNDAGRQLAVCYTGDLGRTGLPIIRDPVKVQDADILIVESTYGNRLHADIQSVDDKLTEVINRAVGRKAKIVVPSFALERTQEIVYTLNRLRQAKRIPDFPIYVDSPLATDATDIFRLHPECFDEDINEFIRTVEDPFGFKHLHYTRSTDESKMLNAINGPIMIIAGSGMAENGRVLHHLKNNIENPNNLVMIVGWQAENTLGRKIAEKWPQVPIFGETHDLKCEVVVFDEFSSHADQNDLIKWISAGKGRWQKIFIVHGEEEASLNLAKDLTDAGFKDVIVPQLGESFAL